MAGALALEIIRESPIRQLFSKSTASAATLPSRKNLVLSSDRVGPNGYEPPVAPLLNRSASTFT
jgi:hypothetical protein